MEENPHVKQSHETGKSALEYLILITDYLSLPLCGASVLADIFLIIVILKYRKLRNRTNLYLLHFAASHIVYIISTPLFYLILDIFFDGQLEVRWFCSWMRVEYFTTALTMSFGAGFGLDVVVKAKKPAWFYKYDQRFSYLFYFFYLFHGILYAIAVNICFRKGLTSEFHFYFLTIYYLLLTIILLYFGIENRNTKLLANEEWALNISIMILLCLLPLFVIYNLMNIFREFHQVEMIMWSISFLPEYLVYFTSIIAVCQLWKSNKHFRSAFQKLLRRPMSISDYEELFVRDNS